MPPKHAFLAGACLTLILVSVAVVPRLQSQQTPGVSGYEVLQNFYIDCNPEATACPVDGQTRLYREAVTGNFLKEYTDEVSHQITVVTSSFSISAYPRLKVYSRRDNVGHSEIDPDCTGGTTAAPRLSFRTVRETNDTQITDRAPDLGCMVLYTEHRSKEGRGSVTYMRASNAYSTRDRPALTTWEEPEGYRQLRPTEAMYLDRVHQWIVAGKTQAEAEKIIGPYETFRTKFEKLDVAR